MATYYHASPFVRYVLETYRAYTILHLMCCALYAVVHHTGIQKHLAQDFVAQKHNTEGGGEIGLQRPSVYINHYPAPSSPPRLNNIGNNKGEETGVELSQASIPFEYRRGTAVSSSRPSSSPIHGHLAPRAKRTISLQCTLATAACVSRKRE